MPKDTLQTNPAVSMLFTAFNTSFKMKYFIFFMMNELIKTAKTRETDVDDDELCATVYADGKAPLFISEVERRRLHIDHTWLRQCIMEFLDANYALTDTDKTALYNFFTSEASCDQLMHRMLFVELFGRHYDLMTTKQLAALGRHDCYPELFFQLSSLTTFSWRSFTISTKKLLKFLLKEEEERDHEYILRIYKTLLYRPNEITKIATKYEEVIETPCHIWLLDDGLSTFRIPAPHEDNSFRTSRK